MLIIILVEERAKEREDRKIAQEVKITEPK